MRGSIRRPLVLYALVSTLTSTLAVVTFASFTMIDAARSDGRHRDPPDAIQPKRVPLGPRIQSVLLFGISTAVVAGLVSGALTSRLVLAPLRDLARNSDGLDPEPLAESAGSLDEVDAVARAFRQSLRRVREEQAALARRTAELAEMQDDLARADKLASVGRVAAGVAHEIGNPLAAVLGYLKFLPQSTDARERDAIVERCLKELGRIHTTITQLLAYARTDRGIPSEETFDLVSLLEDLLRLLRRHPSLHDVELEVDVPSKALVRGDAQRVERALSSLLVNAGQAVRDEADRRVRIRVETQGSMAELTVRDSGPGVPDALRELVFEPFFTTKAEGSGTGLGLALARADLQAMGGDLSLDVGSGGGSTFRVRLPAAGQKLSDS